nr:immunoglobulin light chain junction region [Macaca mulatta]MOV95964.1 immunoglobulin light chain junction region [Macaca mulatta]MOV97706.1 immunoglobulin light chain junction region [Macaca mulatta]MOV99099.1 immunoglobulin light chain junction region [Macaca mulatta]MOW01456.1 immunoglobulin light chain junction region [Macaca mulatta]
DYYCGSYRSGRTWVF